MISVGLHKLHKATSVPAEYREAKAGNKKAMKPCVFMAFSVFFSFFVRQKATRKAGFHAVYPSLSGLNLAVCNIDTSN